MFCHVLFACSGLRFAVRFVGLTLTITSRLCLDFCGSPRASLRLLFGLALFDVGGGRMVVQNVPKVLNLQICGLAILKFNLFPAPPVAISARVWFFASEPTRYIFCARYCLSSGSIFLFNKPRPLPFPSNSENQLEHILELLCLNFLVLLPCGGSLLSFGLHPERGDDNPVENSFFNGIFPWASKL